MDRSSGGWQMHNPGEAILTPFMGVGSEVYSAVRSGRRGLGIELKPSYYRQAVKNVALAEIPSVEERALFDAAPAAGEESAS